MLLRSNMERTYTAISPFSDTPLLDNARSELDSDVEDGMEFIRALKTRRNELALISRLPPEMLSKIFTSYAALCSPRAGEFTCGRTISWIGITQVCRRWREISSDCAGMWAHLIFTNNSPTEEMLRRSKGAPLIIKVDAPYIPTVFEKANLALQHLSRTSVLHLSAHPDAMQIFIERLNGPAPFLESLRLCISTFNGNDALILPETIFDNTTPRLRHVGLWQFKFSWDHPLLSGLTHLELHKVAVLPTMLQMLAVLDRLPLLQTLVLEDSCPAHPISPGTAERVAKLSRLSRLEISSSIVQCANMLNQISYPSDTALYLRCTSVYVDFNLLPIIARAAGRPGNAKPFRTLLIEKNYGYVSIRGWDIAGDPLDLPRPSPSIDLYLQSASGHQVEDDHLGTIITEFCKMLPLTQLWSLHAARISISENAWLDAFGQSTELRTLSACGLVTPHLIRALGSWGETAARSETPCILFPHLRTLIFDGATLYFGLPEALESCLVVRGDYGASMQLIHVHKCWFNDQEVIKGLDNLPVDVMWDGIEQEGPDIDETDFY